MLRGIETAIKSVAAKIEEDCREDALTPKAVRRLLICLCRLADIISISDHRAARNIRLKLRLGRPV